MNTKRAMRDGGMEQMPSRGTAPSLDIAVHTVHSRVDTATISDLQSKLSDPKAGPRFTNMPGLATDWQPTAGKIVWSSKMAPTNDLYVMAPINGMDVGTPWPNDAKATEFWMMARMRPQGLAAQASEDLWNGDPTLAVVKHGIKSAEAYSAIPGARACYALPPLGEEDPRTGSINDGHSGTAQYLITKPANPMAAARRYAHAYGAIMSDMALWNQSMGNNPTPLVNMWQNAAKAGMDHAMFCGLMFFHELVSIGKYVAVAPELRPLGVADPLAQLSAFDQTERVAQFLNLIPDRGQAALLDTPQKRSDWARFKHRVVGSIFYMSNNKEVNTFFEYGRKWDARLVGLKRARTESNELSIGTAAADIVLMQQNASTNLIGSVFEAVNHDLEWSAGVFLTGSAPNTYDLATLSLLHG